MKRILKWKICLLTSLILGSSAWYTSEVHEQEGSWRPMRDSELSMPPTKHSNDGWGSFMRVRVLIDISQPLCRGRVIALDDDRDQWVSFKYEQLPNLCFWCLTHNDKDCDLWIESEGTLAETEKQYRPWIKALSFNGKHRPVVSTLGFYTKKTAKPTKERSQGTTH